MEEKLAGTVQNNMDGVRITWEGSRAAVRRALKRLKAEKPRLSRIDELAVHADVITGRKGFRIIDSDRSGKSSLVIPVDSAVCDNCLKEMRDPSNFRYRYPFINCTQCGPRYSIIDELPYDRKYTSMANFRMCSKCEKEYRDPLNRRHHAQPIACDCCGPHLSLLSSDGELLGEREDALTLAVHVLEKGGIVAVKGIGGFHLACDASNSEAVARLRRCKNRPDKPLAIMARSMEEVRRIAAVSDREENVLRSPEAPIVLLEKNKAFTDLLPGALAPGIRTIGVMLPYTPLHHLLFDDGKFSFLVMTSANPSGLPIVYQDDCAVHYLGGIADQILTHNRPILHAVDDSVVRVGRSVPFFLRRSRGYAPDPINSERNVDGIAALGSQMNNTFAIGRGEQIFVSPHLGDLAAVESMDHYQATLAHVMKWAGVTPRAIAIDRHPYYSTREIAAKLGQPIVEVQHHHAHLVSCMEDNGLTGNCIGLILDGTGYGADGNVWGFEVLYGGACGYQRLAHLRYTPLAGGDRAVTEPWRNATAMLISLLGDEGRRLAARLFPDQSAGLRVIDRMTEMKLNSPMAGTCGRLFDAVSAIIGLCKVSTYEGEPAILLSECADEGNRQVEPYPYRVTWEGTAEIDFSLTLKQIAEDHLHGLSAARISRRFHETVVSVCCSVIHRIACRHPEFGRRVVLSGGSLNNRFLARHLQATLAADGFDVFTHHRMPCGDGGLCLGQLVVAAEMQVGKT